MVGYRNKVDIVILPATFTVTSVDEKHLCSALHVIDLSCFHRLEETVTWLIIWVVFLTRVAVLPSVTPQVTSASRTVRTEHVAFTLDFASITSLKLGISTWMGGGALERTAGKKNMHFIILKHSAVFILCCETVAYLLWQILIVLLSWSLRLDLHVNFEPASHSVIFGSISLLRLKVSFSPLSKLCSFLWIPWMSRVWSSRSHVTSRSFGKKPLRVQMSLTDEVPNSPSQSGCNAMFGEATRGSEIEKK